MVESSWILSLTTNQPHAKQKITRIRLSWYFKSFVQNVFGVTVKVSNQNPIYIGD